MMKDQMKDVNHKTAGSDYAFVLKVGATKNGWQNVEYCGKVLHMVKDRKFSYHCHKLKEETFLSLRVV